MKIIHCSDLHLDSKMESNLDRDKAKQRKKELLLTFERMVKFAQSEKVEAIIIAGDMFDSSRVSIKTRNRIFDIIKTNGNIDFLYLSGNHDEKNIIGTFEDLDNLKIFKEDWTSFDYGNVCISGIILGNSKAPYETLNLNKDKFNIVVLHGQLSQYNGDNSEIINLTKLKGKNIDYLALGHIHKYEEGVLDGRGFYCYPGCLEGRGFDECGKKGFVLLETDGKILSKNFVEFAYRTFYQLDYDITPYEDWFDCEREILKEVENYRSDDILKIVLKGRYKITLDKQIEHLEMKLKDKFFFAKIKDESALEIRAEDFIHDQSLKGEFIRTVLASQLKDDEKERVILLGLKALAGEEVK